MTTLNYSLIEPYHQTQLYTLVNDINAYPEFVPDCIQSGIVQEQGNRLIAFIEVAKLGFHKRFITQNTLTAPKQIDITLVEGPFRYLNGSWKFIPITQLSCQVMFDLQFEFKNRVLEYALTPIFREIMYNMVHAFSVRAKQVYHD